MRALAPLLIALLALPGCGEDVPLKDALISMGDDVAIEMATTEAAIEMPVLDVPEVAVKAPEPSGPHAIKMRSGESFALYARWIGTIPEKIAKQNKLDPYGKFRVGQKLVLDLGSMTPEQFDDKRMAWQKGRLATYLKKRGGVHKVIKHKVRKGETVLGIARRNGRLPLWVMRHYNQDRNLDRLSIGDIVRVPLTNDRVTARR